MDFALSAPAITGGKVLSIPQFRQKVRGLRRDARKAGRQILVESAEVLEMRWKELILERAYKTGEFYDSVSTEVTNDLEVIVGATARNEVDGYPYPEALEFGTMYMAPRPTLRPAIDMSRGEVEGRAAEVFQDFVETYFP